MVFLESYSLSFHISMKLWKRITSLDDLYIHTSFLFRYMYSFFFIDFFLYFANAYTHSWIAWSLARISSTAAAATIVCTSTYTRIVLRVAVESDWVALEKDKQSTRKISKCRSHQKLDPLFYSFSYFSFVKRLLFVTVIHIAFAHGVEFAINRIKILYVAYGFCFDFSLSPVVVAVVSEYLSQTQVFGIYFVCVCVWV